MAELSMELMHQSMGLLHRNNGANSVSIKKKKDINENNVVEICNTCWDKVIEKVRRGYPMLSERTLVFIYAMELFLYVNNPTLVIEFESRPFTDIGKTAFLDLLAYTSQDYKVAFEFKLPLSNSKGQTNQTETRKEIYKDLYRLQYLVDNRTCGCGIFLMGTDERAYVKKGNHKKHPEYCTHDSHTNNQMSLKLYDKECKVSCEFKWKEKEESAKLYWLDPIIF